MLAQRTQVEDDQAEFTRIWSRATRGCRWPLATSPASRHAEIGGDFYEVTELDGRMLIAVGDVSGHSLEAATVMGEVRHVLRADAVEGHGLVRILEHLDTMVQRFHPEGLTTACLMLVDPETGATEVASAGHIRRC